MNQPVKITAIVENTCYRHNLLGSHGQSILIETSNENLLFDVGEIFCGLKHNLDQLEVKISDIHKIIISHRHIDHIGSLTELISLLKNQEIWLPMQLGEKHLKKKSEKYRFLKSTYLEDYNLAITKSDTKKLLKHKNIKIVDKDEEITKNIYTTGSIGTWMKEQAIVIDQKELGITIIIGCAHPTLESIIETATKITKNKKIRGIIGGFHFVDITDAEIRKKARWLKSLNPSFLIPSHCTTIKGNIILKEELGTIVQLSKSLSFGVGNSVELGNKVKFNFS